MSKWITVILMLLFCSTSGAQTPEELRTHVEYLASDALGGRAPASEGMGLAIKYVKAECKKLGLKVFKQEVGQCLNTIAVLEGTTDDRIVVGAHLDHLGSRRGEVYNGADDNASGCALTLALAKQLAAGKPPRCTYEFHFYTKEEVGMKGSAQYVKSPLADIKQYKFMLNLDMVGRLQESKLLGESDDFPFDAVFTQLYDKYLFASRITWTENTNDSDHASWWNKGVPAAMLHTGLHDEYHEPEDDTELIDFEGMVEVSSYALDILRGVEQQLHPQDMEADDVDMDVEDAGYDLY